ncbi:hypothetical protein ACFLVS_05070 [Chloroflexota bacterium]
MSRILPEVLVDYPAQFPGLYIILTSILEIINAPIIELAKYYPMFSSAVTLLVILLIFRTFLPSVNYRWALAISALANVYMYFNISPQSAGLIADILTLIALEKPGLRWKFIAILLFVFIVISHPTTAFILLPVMMLVWLLRIVLLREVKVLIDLAPVFLAMWLVWVMVHAVALEESVIGLAGTASTLGMGVIEAMKRDIGNIFYYAPKIRFAVLAIFGLASAYYLITQWLDKVNRRNSNLAPYTAFLLVHVLMTLVDVTLLKGEEQLHDRYFLFFSISNSCFNGEAGSKGQASTNDKLDS